MTLQIEKFVDPTEAFDTLTPEWEDLDAAMLPRALHSSPAWIRLWWRHLRRQTISTRDEFFLHTVRDQYGRLVAVAPLMLTHKPGRGLLRLRLLQFIGADLSLTEVRGLICRIEHQDTAVRALIGHFAKHCNEWDLFLWRGFRLPGLSVELLDDLGGLNKDDALPCYIVELPTSWDELATRLSSNTRKSMRKSYEFLERDGYNFGFRSREHPNDIPEALSRFFSLHAARSLSKDMTLHRDRLTGYPKHSALVADFARTMAERGQLRMFQLEIGGAIIATRIAFVLGDDLCLYYSGFDPRWRKYSVMTTLSIEIMKWAINNGFKRVNLSTGADLGKLRWRPSEVLYYNKNQVSPTWRGQAASRLYTLLR